MKLGAKIAQQRRRAGISQEELASRMGLSRQAVSRWETGDSTPDTEKVVQLSRMFHVSTDYLLLDEIEDVNGMPAPSAASPVESAGPKQGERRRFQTVFGVTILTMGLVSILAALCLAGIWAVNTNEWLTRYGPFGTGLLRTWRLIPLVLGAVLTVGGGWVLGRIYRTLN